MFGKKNKQGGQEDCVAVPGQKNNTNSAQEKRVLVTQELVQKRYRNAFKYIHQSESLLIRIPPRASGGTVCLGPYWKNLSFATRQKDNRQGYFKELDFENILVIEIYFDPKQNHYCFCCIFYLRANEPKPYFFGWEGAGFKIGIPFGVQILDYVMNRLYFPVFSSIFLIQLSKIIFQL